MQIREVMTLMVRTVAPETTLPEIARIMRDEDIGSVPVAEDDRLIGMVTDRDVVVRGLVDGSAEGKCARDVMSAQVLYCRQDQEVDEVLENMGQQQVRRLPVVNSGKRLVGMVSLGDLSGTATESSKAGEALKEISQPNGH